MIIILFMIYGVVYKKDQQRLCTAKKQNINVDNVIEWNSGMGYPTQEVKVLNHKTKQIDTIYINPYYYEICKNAWRME